MVALLDGRLLSPGQPLVRADDPGLNLGDGAFETTLVVDGGVRDLAEHLQRLAESAQALQIGIPSRQDWLRGVDAVVSAWTSGREMRLRLTFTRGPQDLRPVCWATGDPVGGATVAERTRGVGVRMLSRGFTAETAAQAPWLLTGVKALSYAVNSAALRYARDNGAQDAIFVGADGEILEGVTSAVVAAVGDRLVTPPPVGILDSITTRRLFAAARKAGWDTDRRRMTAADLTEADGVWLVSAVRLLAPVTSLDGVPLPANRLTPVLARLLDVPDRPYSGSDDDRTTSAGGSSTSESGGR